jgi:hypothetical protein
MIFVLVASLCALLLAGWVLAPRMAPWEDQLTRVQAGAGEKAEWMAPPQVVEEVTWSYREAQAWLADCAADWGRFAQGLERHACGPYLRAQSRALARLVTQRPRLAATLTAAHEYSVHRFSGDGLRCLLVDRQTARLLTTSNYWTGRAVHLQRLDDAALVFQMCYHVDDKRWKIERLIQQLPLGTPPRAGRKTKVHLAPELPAAAGRDS